MRGKALEPENEGVGLPDGMFFRQVFFYHNGEGHPNCFDNINHRESGAGTSITRENWSRLKMAR